MLTPPGVLRTLALITAFVLAPVAAGAEALTLSAAVERALRSHPDLAVARARLGESEAERISAGLLLRSNPVLQGEGARSLASEEAADYRFGASISQQLELAGQRGLRIDSADAALGAASGRLSALERTIAREAADAYFDAWLARQERELQTRIVEIAEAVEQAAALRYRSGDVSELDAGLASVEVARARAELATAEGRERAAAAQLQLALGAAAGEVPELSDAPPDALVEVPAGARRPELEAAELAVRSAEAERALRSRERVPSPTLSVGYDHELLAIHGHLPGGQDATFTHASGLLGVSLSIPLPVWDRNQAGLRAAEAGRELARAERTRVGLALVSEQHAAEALAEGAARAFSERKRALPTVERNLALLEKAFDAGQIGMVDLLGARERAFAARREYLQARAQYGRALNALAWARGALPPGASR